MEARRKIRAACIQLNAGCDWRRNLARTLRLAETALRRRAKIIALPENFCARGPAADLDHQSRIVTPSVVETFRALARKEKAAFLLGSVIETSPHKGRYYNTSLLISETGKITARYRKIHLFDIGLKTMQVRESKHIVPGKSAMSAKVFGQSAGLTVCYDLRFPELYRRLVEKGCRLFFVPANFTQRTGLAHWEVLLRARAIENQAFVLAPAQTGKHPESGIRSYGNSLILDPWGRVLAQGSGGREEVITADLDFGYQTALRREFPVLKHRRVKG